MKYFFVPQARKEHLDAVSYYESKQAGLGREYLTEFQQIIQKVCSLPSIYPIEIQPNIRRIRLKRFPYTILFRQSNDQIQILAVAHHRRQPDYWVERT